MCSRFLVLHFLIMATLNVQVHPQAQAQRFPCGKTKIAYGNDDKRVQSPWTAIVFHKTTETRGIYVDWIGAVILGPQTLLTRGRQFWEAGNHSHKPLMRGFNADNFLVGVGILDRNSFQMADGVTQILQVDSIRPHPKSYLEHSEFDLAIVQLRQPIQFSSKIHAICVEAAEQATFTSAYDLRSKFFTGPKKLSGFGANNSTVNAMPYRLGPADVCDRKCQIEAPSSNEAQLLWGGRRAQSPCDMSTAGDLYLPGASLASWHQNRWYLAGIVTKTYGCHPKFKHFVSLVAVAPNLRWINANVRNGPRKYSCMDGSAIEKVLLCNGKVDCKGEGEGGSDEEAAYCQAINCPPQSLHADRCTFGNDEDPSVYLVRNGSKSLLRLNRESLKPVGSVAPDRWAGTTRRPSATSVPTRSTQVSIATTTTSPAQFVFPGTTRRSPATPSISGGGGVQKCPPIKLTQREREGVRLRCNSPGRNSVPANECLNSPAAPGTRVVQTCAEGYKSTGRYSFSELICGQDGVWSGGGRYLTCIAECGMPKVSLTGHIVNGTAAVPRNWPWNAAVFKRAGDEFKYLCGATLITSRTLVTAAHCVHESMGTAADSLSVVLAPTSSTWTTNLNSKQSQVLQIGQIHVHHLYNPHTFEGDIALIKTREIVQISKNVYPACFPFPGRENEQIERIQTSAGSVGVVAAFGTDELSMISETLKEVRLPIVSVRDCFRVLDVFPTVAQLCAGYTTGISVCNGDSGAGFLFQEEGARKLYFLQGIVSHGQADESSRMCDYNRYSIFTRVGSFKEWVEQIVATD